MRTDLAPQPIRLADYRPPDFLIDRVDLVFDLAPNRTRVRARLSLRRNPAGVAGAPLTLDGEHLELLSLAMDGAPLAPGRFEVGERTLTVFDPPDAFTLESEVAIAPAANTALSGLYMSNGMYCTQCEAEGFRRITYYLDRPDVLARFRVRIEADRAAAPVLLANGNPAGAGPLAGDRHFAEWDDPFPKPAYLFALVGGDLAAVEDSFTTRSGRRVALKVFVQPQNRDRCGYTLGALKRAMAWDETAFGREYDLDLFMIVAVDHFNFGAMENKGLNIFNSAYVLASPETATDADYEAIESIVAHEYFHNWSGNRVTCRDWFQLCLKEGFTVFRDQEFSADMRSAPVQRIKEVRRLWAQQFPEDAGPLAHPPRPDQYLTIDNFYTATVYEKGAEIVRMLKTLLGPQRFRAACDLYFERHDGTAATVEDFVRAMEEAGGVDLAQFRRWYSDAGTPALRAAVRTEAGGVRLDLSQDTQPTPGQPDKPPRTIPVAYSVYGTRTRARLAAGLIEFRTATASHSFGAFDEPVVVSLLDGFSAPVRLEREQSVEERLFLAAHCEDLFNRWAATESLWRDLCLGAAGARPGAAVGDALGATIARFAAGLAEAVRGPDPALAAELLRCPSAGDLARLVDSFDPQAIAEGRARVRAAVGQAIEGDLVDLHRRLRRNAPFEPTAAQAGERALKNAALQLLVDAGEDSLAFEQACAADNMTDEAAATAALAVSRSPRRAEALARFRSRWQADPLVLNKWFAWRALAPGPDAINEIEALLADPAYDAASPNTVRAVLGVFARENLTGFHRADAAGYELFMRETRAIDARNPQLAARLLTAVDNWRRIEPGRRQRIEAGLTALRDSPGVSRNLFEIAERLLKS